MTILAQLAPHVRRVGLREVARRCKAAGVRGISAPRLSAWLCEYKRTDGPPRTMNDRQIDAIAKACGVTITITKEPQQ